MAADPMKNAQAEAKGTPDYGTVTFDGVDYTIVRKPNTLLISELARTGSGDPEALAVFADFFQVTLGDGYQAFKKAIYRSDDADEAMQGLLQEILEKTLGRPTD